METWKVPIQITWNSLGTAVVLEEYRAQAAAHLVIFLPVRFGAEEFC